jgi:hypothetical protein
MCLDGGCAIRGQTARVDTSAFSPHLHVVFEGGRGSGGDMTTTINQIELALIATLIAMVPWC